MNFSNELSMLDIEEYPIVNTQMMNKALNEPNHHHHCYHDNDDYLSKKLKYYSMKSCESKFTIEAKLDDNYHLKTLKNQMIYEESKTNGKSNALDMKEIKSKEHHDFFDIANEDLANKEQFQQSKKTLDNPVINSMNHFNAKHSRKDLNSDDDVNQAIKSNSNQMICKLEQRENVTNEGLSIRGNENNSNDYAFIIDQDIQENEVSNESQNPLNQFANNNNIISENNLAKLDNLMSYQYMNKCKCPKILIVVETSLASFGYICCVAFNGKLAIQKVIERENNKCSLSCGQYKLILMDLDMPEINGIEATKILKAKIKDEIIKPIRIIGYTEFMSSNSKKECIESGIDDFISKPIRIAKLKELLKYYIAKQNQSFEYNDNDYLVHI